MTTVTIFGIALAPLYAAIAQVESDRGATSDNVYQIRQIYVRDVNRIMGRNAFANYDVSERRIAEKMMYIYWTAYGTRYERNTGNHVTYEVLARIHNGGPDGWKKPETVGYWKRVEAVLNTQTQADVDAWSKGGVR